MNLIERKVMLNAGKFALSEGGTSNEEIASLVESEMVGEEIIGKIGKLMTHPRD